MNVMAAIAYLKCLCFENVSQVSAKTEFYCKCLYNAENINGQAREVPRGKAFRYTFVVGTNKEGQAHVKVM